ncbi:MAG: hypothetical protein COV34_02815 [Candidatus Zambryskibacteria bacterium CG10_big_fil_rev_8_21_14_0_10_42_12]|uniref:DUF2269 domain-containing protein n=1 Tax=Candidatus Zambryskibacteria bacterium CG10_big_fil_rev_8_21_14_0_10_42_12 TaxID=1975115 RepID=A0A2H0QW01_9BACT|nr:MAG: hypothetical protein COV34_02815 [Candidatus Zambryskibacteria bacterium CG10_big_fil_rev_8_21_14_0_10_42_12]
METIGLFLFIAGFIIGLGAVTVIDTLGFLGRQSSYWTLTTIRAHKVTKPLIWIGTLLAVIGGFLFYSNKPFQGIPVIHGLLAILLVLNGIFLSFYVSPRLLKQEKDGEADKILPKTLQNKIKVSFVVSFVGWWSVVLLLAYYLVTYGA